MAFWGKGSRSKTFSMPSCEADRTAMAPCKRGAAPRPGWAQVLHQGHADDQGWSQPCRGGLRQVTVPAAGSLCITSGGGDEVDVSSCSLQSERGSGSGWMPDRSGAVDHTMHEGDQSVSAPGSPARRRSSCLMSSATVMKTSPASLTAGCSPVGSLRMRSRAVIAKLNQFKFCQVGQFE